MNIVNLIIAFIYLFGMTPTPPSLFGIKYSNRDFSKSDNWSKNRFNSSFPAALILYMASQNKHPVYLKLNKDGEIEKHKITATELFGVNPLSEDLYYSFESRYTPFQPLCIGHAPAVDLMVIKNDTKEPLAGFEVKLTTLPDETTAKLAENKYGSELVIRPPSIQFLACSLASIYKDNHEQLKTYFGQNGFGNPASYTESAQVNPVLGQIGERLNRLVKDNVANQKPAIIQPIWRTQGKKAILSDNCLDVFVWSDLAFTRLFMTEALTAPVDQTMGISRPNRALIQLFFMLNEVCISGKFNAKDILQKLAYKVQNDKAFSVSGVKTNKMMACDELFNPRISKLEIKNIILGGGQKLLSPERRFDAVLVSSPDLFT